MKILALCSVALLLAIIAAAAVGIAVEMWGK
jgi:hypothetical protein